MYMLSPMWMQISFSTAGGGGVPGKAAGTVPVTTIGVGVITGTFHLFIDIFLPDGETITAITGGEDMNGNIKGSLTETFNVIGAAGKETDIGKDRIPGA
jgi:hypothetical protein